MKKEANLITEESGECFARKKGECAILKSAFGFMMEQSGECNTFACPFYKPSDLWYMIRLPEGLKTPSEDVSEVIKGGLLDG